MPILLRLYVDVDRVTSCTRDFSLRHSLFDIRYSIFGSSLSCRPLSGAFLRPPALPVVGDRSPQHSYDFPFSGWSALSTSLSTSSSSLESGEPRSTSPSVTFSADGALASPGLSASTAGEVTGTDGACRESEGAELGPHELGPHVGTPSPGSTKACSTNQPTNSPARNSNSTAAFPPEDLRSE